jgi:hypothetical protein
MVSSCDSRMPIGEPGKHTMQKRMAVNGAAAAQRRGDRTAQNRKNTDAETETVCSIIVDLRS